MGNSSCHLFPVNLDTIEPQHNSTIPPKVPRKVSVCNNYERTRRRSVEQSLNSQRRKSAPFGIRFAVIEPAVYTQYDVRNIGRHSADKGSNENNLNSVAECPLWLPAPSHPEDTDRSEDKRNKEKRQRKTTIVSQQQPKIKTINASESCLLKNNKSLECIYKNPIDIKPSDSDENIYINPI